MKKTFNTPEIDITKFDCQDVITTSGEPSNSSLEDNSTENDLNGFFKIVGNNPFN